MPENKKLQLFLLGLLITIMVFITYRGAFDNDFVDWDDFGYVVNNDLVRNPGDSFLRDLFTTPVSSNYHPLTIFSMHLNANVCDTCPNGISPMPFIRWNVILHILNSLLVLMLVFLLSKRNILVAFLTAAVFGVHPMHVESVAWISERKDVLYTFFFLSGLIAYVKFLKHSGRKNPWLVISFILFLLSCLSKATAVVFPVILVFINFWNYDTDEEKPVIKSIKNALSVKNILLLLPFFIVSVIIGLMAYKIQSGENFMGMMDLGKNQPDVVNEIGPFSVLQRFQIASYGFVLYIIKFFIPIKQSALYAYPTLQEFTNGSFGILLYLSLAGFISIAILTIYSMRKTKLFAFGIGFYFVTVALVLQFITVGMAIMAERYSYLPYIGLSIIPAVLIAGSTKSKKIILLMIAGCFIIMLMIMSVRQVRVWQNTETLWTRVIDKDPRLELPRRSRGKYYSKKAFQAKNDTDKKMFEDKALVDFKEAIKAGTNSSDVFQGTGVIYGSKGDLENAVYFLNIAIRMDPKKGSAFFNRALIFDQLNKKQEAINDYNMALIYKPEWALEILNNRSNLLLETGKFTLAINDFDYLISLESNNFLYYYNRAFAKQYSNDISGAVSDYQKALQLKPDDQMAKARLQKILSK
jgi:lipoprotein NlpI